LLSPSRRLPETQTESDGVDSFFASALNLIETEIRGKPGPAAQQLQGLVDLARHRVRNGTLVLAIIDGPGEERGSAQWFQCGIGVLAFRSSFTATFWSDPLFNAGTVVHELWHISEIDQQYALSLKRLEGASARGRVENWG
jgi:hypothetical protein